MMPTLQDQANAFAVLFPTDPERARRMYRNASNDAERMRLWIDETTNAVTEIEADRDVEAVYETGSNWQAWAEEQAGKLTEAVTALENLANELYPEDTPDDATAARWKALTEQIDELQDLARIVSEGLPS